MSVSEPVAIARVENLTKRFPRVVAVDDVSIDFLPGRVHAVVGENGAGKTTLMNVIYGVHQPDAGSIVINGRAVTIRRPADAIREGVALVHQHFKLVPSFTVADNLMMIEHRKLGFVPDRRAFAETIVDVGRRYGLEVNPHARVRELPLGLQQRVEILAGLLRDARLLILDEPTTVLAPPEVADLFETLNRIADEGRAVVLITHKLTEVFDVADTFSVMRRGALVRTGRTADSSPAEVASLMVGRDLGTLGVPTTGEQERGVVALRVEDVHVPAKEASPGLSSVTFALHEGEILAVAGVEGNGQSELVEVLAQLRTPTAGRIILGDRDVTDASRRQSAKLGVGVIPGDRQAEGLILPMSVTENVSLDRIREPEFSRHGLWLLVARIRAFARKAVEDYKIQASSVKVPVRMLSGGNQQKVVLARVLSSNPRILIAAQPTRGLDIAATRYVLDQLTAARASGTGILLFSSDLDHVLSLADRVLVLFRGRVVAVLEARTATRDELGRYMAGVGSTPSDDAAVDEGAGHPG